ncbi:MAG: Crp/Fnr family transcriptional regulator [Pseudomonadota bacterium]
MYRIRPDPGSWIDELEPELASWVRGRMRRRVYQDGEVLSPAWEPIQGVYEIYRGSIKIMASSADGREMILNVISAGHTMNETPIISERGIMGTSAVCVGETEVGLLLADDFKQLCIDHPAINAHLARRLAMRNAATYNQLIDAGLHRLELRLAFLVYTYAREDEAGVNRMPFTQDDLANMSGVSRQSINRVIRTWEAEGLIELGYGHLKIPDFPALLNFAQSDKNTA